ncbi:MAG: hypothetical protein AAFV95_08495 [Bacteroidota bacterium]
MHAKQLIGRKIKDLLLYLEMEVGGLDEAEVFIQLDNGITVNIPWDFESDDLACEPREGAESLFANLEDIPQFHVNPEGKTVGEVLEAQKKRTASLWGRLKKLFGLIERIPKEYLPYRVEYRENKVKYLKDQTIADILVMDSADIEGFILLENGYIFTEKTIGPHGTGMAGLYIYQNIQEMETAMGTNYQRLTDMKD